MKHEKLKKSDTSNLLLLKKNAFKKNAKLKNTCRVSGFSFENGIHLEINIYRSKMKMIQ